MESLNGIIEQLEKQRSAIDKALLALRELDGFGAPVTAASPSSEAVTGVRMKRSAAARQRMKEAQQRRWAKIHGESEQPLPVITPEEPKKRKISPEGLKRIAAATKKRWARVRAESANATKKAAPKKAGKKAAAKSNAADEVPF